MYGGLADLPPDLERLANITNAEPRYVCKVDVAEFAGSINLIRHLFFFQRKSLPLP